MQDQAHLSDNKFAIEAIKKHEETFGITPNTLGYDRGAYSEANIKKVKKDGSQKYWHCSQRPKRMGYYRRRIDRPCKTREGPSRRLHRNNQMQKI